MQDRFPFELTVYAADKAHYVFKSSITGKAIERASVTKTACGGHTVQEVGEPPANARPVHARGE